jgi:uncharacterized repeat protein (TIGR01451 family)
VNRHGLKLALPLAAGLFMAVLVAAVSSSERVATGFEGQAPAVEDNSGAFLDAAGVMTGETLPADASFNQAQGSPDRLYAPGFSAEGVCFYWDGPAHANEIGQLASTLDLDSNRAGGASAMAKAALTGDGALQDDPTSIGADGATLLAAAPDLQVAITDGLDSARPDDQLAYTIAFTNTGEQSASGVVLTETVPAMTTFNSGQSTAGSGCSGATSGSSCRYSAGVVSGFGGGQIVFAVDVVWYWPFPEPFVMLHNTVEIGDDGASGPDENPADNVATDYTWLYQSPEISVVSPAVQAVSPGDMIVDVAISAVDLGSEFIALCWTTPLPNALSLHPVRCGTAARGGRECSWTVSGQMLEGAGVYRWQIQATDGIYWSDPATDTFIVLPLDTRQYLPSLST